MDNISYRINEAVKVTGLGRTKLYELISSGRLPVVKLDGCTLVRRCDLEALLDQHLAA
jgi:excisionase family DNA binding protein